MRVHTINCIPRHVLHQPHQVNNNFIPARFHLLQLVALHREGDSFPIRHCHMLLTSLAPHIPSLQKMHYLLHHPYQETRVSCLVANFPYSLLYQPIKVSPLPPPYKTNNITLSSSEVLLFFFFLPWQGKGQILSRSLLPLSTTTPPPWQGGSSLLYFLYCPHKPGSEFSPRGL